MKVTFVADYYMEDLPGGSERSLQAIIDSAPGPVKCIKSHDFRLRDFGKDDFIIFGNFSSMNLSMLPSIARSLNYAVIESDHKYCAERSPELHKHKTGQECDCHKNDYGKRILNFYMSAKVLFWKSSIHFDRHLKAFPALKDKANVILSATYSDKELDFIDSIVKSHRWPIFGYATFKSDSWIKGYKEAVEYCEKNKLWRVDIASMSWENTIKTLSRRKGLVFLPNSMESCSRIAIEAHLLGLDCIVNKNVPVAQEKWFEWPREKAIEYLRGRTKMFWTTIMAYMYVESRG